MREVDHSSCQGVHSDSVSAEIKPNVDVCLAKGSILIASFSFPLLSHSYKSEIFKCDKVQDFMVVVAASLCSLMKNEKVENTKHTNIETSWKNVPYKEGKLKDSQMCPEASFALVLKQ